MLLSLPAGAFARVPISVAALVRDAHVLLVHRHRFRPSDLAALKVAHPGSLSSILGAVQGAT